MTNPTNPTKPETENQESLEAFFGLPAEVCYCAKCVESNQRMIGSVQHSDTSKTKKDTMIFDEEGVCGACQFHEGKKDVDWVAREKMLVELLDKHRRSDGEYDVLVPGSGGKDSRYTAHILKYKYGMNPLTVTWAPSIYTDIGWKNLQSWIHSGLDNILYTPNGAVHAKLTRLSFENLLHPFQPFILGQYYLAHKVAIEKNIKLIMYGDSHAERGKGKKSEVTVDDARLDRRLFGKNDDQEIFFGGVSLKDLEQHGITRKDLNPYLPPSLDQLEKHEIGTFQLPYFLNYDPQKMFYYVVEKTGFEPNPDGRSEGTYTKYSSLDDKVDGFHHFTWFIKTGRGRATEDAALEVRNGHISREEAVALVKRFDGEFPKKYFKDFLEYIDMTEEQFWATIDRFRSPHIWKKEDGEWKVRQQVS